MNIKECYAAMGGDYEDVIGRLRSEKLVEKFAVKFLNDGSFDLLSDSLENKNYDEAFRAAHTLKGICQNLGFTDLYVPSNKMTETLRAGGREGLEEQFEEVKANYDKTVAAIRQLG